MPGKPAEVLLGVIGIAFGALLAYAAYKNEPLWGPNGGILEDPLTKGTFYIWDGEPWFGSLAESGITGQLSQQNPATPELARWIADDAAIAKKDRILAAAINVAANQWSPASKQSSTPTLEALFAEAEKEGLSAPVADMRQLLVFWATYGSTLATAPPSTGGGVGEPGPMPTPSAGSGGGTVVPV